MKICGTAYGDVSYELFGSAGPVLAIDAALCSCGAEWRHIAQRLGKRCRALVFDRAGYGGSPPNGRPRTPANIAGELNALLDALGIGSKLLLLGHSQGGLYAVQYALTYPQKVAGLVLLDPATPYDGEFRKRLTALEYRRSGVDKSVGFRMGLLLASLGLGLLFRPLLRKSPPFHYHNFEPEDEKLLLGNLTRRGAYATALEEYEYSHASGHTADIRKAVETGGLGSIPVRLITHSSAFYVEEMRKYAGLGEETAAKVERIWQDIMLRYLKLSDDSLHIVARNSGHYIHLTDYDTVESAVYGLLPA